MGSSLTGWLPDEALTLGSTEIDGLAGDTRPCPWTPRGVTLPSRMACAISTLPETGLFGRSDWRGANDHADEAIPHIMNVERNTTAPASRTIRLAPERPAA